MNKKRLLCIILSLTAAIGMMLIRDSAAWIDTKSGEPLPQTWAVQKMKFDFEGTLDSYLQYDNGNDYIVSGQNLIWDNGGKISVRIDTSPADAVIVTISDTGIGMSDDVQKHIFERFYQGDTSRKSHGNGLGLAIVKKIADLIDCEISVNSTLGVGSTFTVTLKQ